MSYAVETKKRKFDRILEQLSDHSTHSRAALNTRNNASTISLVAEESGSAKKPRITPSSSTEPLTPPSTVSLITNYLPSDRTAFLERLETFRQVTKWRISSTEPINAAAWAKRGWTCIDTDLVSCGACREQLHVQVDVEEETSADTTNDENDENDEPEENQYEAVSEVHSEIVKRYQSLIVNGHTDSCSWRRRGCDSSIQRIEGLLNTSNAISSLLARYKSIAESDPNLPAVQCDQLERTEKELERFHFEENVETDMNTLTMAMCGWHGKGEEVVECRHCFRSLGLWLYRGEEPTMERLDPVGSHLEYCPWRSPEAQDTEIAISEFNGTENEPKKRRVVGWELAFQAILKG